MRHINILSEAFGLRGGASFCDVARLQKEKRQFRPNKVLSIVRRVRVNKRDVSLLKTMQLGVATGRVGYCHLRSSWDRSYFGGVRTVAAYLAMSHRVLIDTISIDSCRSIDTGPLITRVCAQASPSPSNAERL